MLIRSMIGPLLLLLPGCIIPHTYQDLPGMEGVVERGGQPLSGITVRLSDTTRVHPCQEGEQQTETNDLGEFFFAGRRGFRLIAYPIPIHSLDTYALCFLERGRPLGFVAPWDYRAGPRHAPEFVTMKCNLDLRECVVDNHRLEGYAQEEPIQSYVEPANQGVAPDTATRDTGS